MSCHVRRSCSRRKSSYLARVINIFTVPLALMPILCCCPCSLHDFVPVSLSDVWRRFRLLDFLACLLACDRDHLVRWISFLTRMGRRLRELDETGLLRACLKNVTLKTFCPSAISHTPCSTQHSDPNPLISTFLGSSYFGPLDEGRRERYGV